jgi:phage FluMu protein gp41
LIDRGKIHILQLQIGTAFFPCSVSVMDDPAPGATEMPFLLGLDMMKRHVCSVNLQKGVLQFPLAGVEIPFLHEKDLGTEQGGTRGFDANKANQEVEEFLRKEQEEEKGGSSSGDNGEDKKDKPDDTMDESK